MGPFRSKIVSVFTDLHELLTTGQFDSQDIVFIEKYLDSALAATRKLREKISEEKLGN